MFGSGQFGKEIEATEVEGLAVVGHGDENAGPRNPVEAGEAFAEAALEGVAGVGVASRHHSSSFGA